ncbi:MAG TPA: arylesterase [Aestuariivirgaceae bacterium]|jgi:acyl-CoA thioesterase-1
MRLVVFLAVLLGMVAGSTAAAQPLKLVVLGDSLTAGYGIDAEDAFPAKLEAALIERGHHVVVENAGVSGDTASQGLERVDWSVAKDADAVIVELGANDALRGVNPSETHKSLDEIIAGLKKRDVAVMLAGMLAPPNLGASFKEQFDAIYPALAKAHNVVLYPFFLDGVASEPKFNLDDGIHPNAQGVEEIVKRILPKVEEFLRMVKH